MLIPEKTTGNEANWFNHKQDKQHKRMLQERRDCKSKRKESKILPAPDLKEK